jgi:phasin family protein
MIPFSPAVTPAVRSHLDAQVSFFNAMSQSLSRSFQQLCELNIQLGQTMLEEGNSAGQQWLTTDNATDVIAIATSRAQPAADKLSAYQQHIARMMAEGQLDLARVAEQHSQVTFRTARELADQVAQAAAQETEKGIVKQQEMMKNFRDPFQQHAAEHGNTSVAARGNLQSANGLADAQSPSSGASSQGNQSTAPAGSKGGTKAA